MKIRIGCVFACAAALVAVKLPAQQKLTLHHHDAAHQVPGTIIIPAADFLRRTFRRATRTTGGGRNRGRTWFFNDSTVN